MLDVDDDFDVGGGVDIMVLMWGISSAVWCCVSRDACSNCTDTSLFLIPPGL